MNRRVHAVQQRSRASSQETGECNRAFWKAAVSKDPDFEGIYPEGVGPNASNHWLVIPGTSFILSLALTRYGVGWFVRGQLGSKDEVTAELLGDHLNTLKLELSCDEKRPYLSRWIHHDWNETDAQETMIEWFIDEKEKVMNAFNHLALKR